MKKCKICKTIFKPKGRQKCCTAGCSRLNDLRNYRKYDLMRKRQRKAYYIKNKIKIDKQHEVYDKTHSVEIRERKRVYYLKNKIEVLQCQKKYEFNKRRNDINYRIRKSLRCRIWHALKHNVKSSTTTKLLGCNIDLLRLYLQSKFQPGMSFSNYGKWHIDHIKPCASFDLTKKSEQKLCFHYTNLQPLWAIDNLKKHAKIN